MALGNGRIDIPPAPVPFDLNAPSAPQQATQPQGRGSITPPAAPKPFVLPDGTAPKTDPTEGMTPIQKGGEVAQGVTKGLLGQILGSSAAKAGPVGADMLAHAPAFAKNIQAADEVSTPTNGYQTAGAFAGSLIAPGFSGKAEAGVMAANKFARAGEDAIKIAGPKMTLGTVEKGITSLSDDPYRIQKVANAIKGMVEQKILKVGNDAKTATANAEAIKAEIVKTAEGLKNSLKNSSELKQPFLDMAKTLGKPTRALRSSIIVSKKELNGVFKDALAEVDKNPYLEEGARTQAKKMFDLFNEQLPKGEDIMAHDVLDARQSFDSAIGKMKPNAFDPKSENATSIALKAIRRGVNDLIAEKAPDVKVKAALARQTALYDALENIGKKGAPAIKEAMEIASKTGIRGAMARHPLITSLGASIAGGAATALGLGGLLKLTGQHLSE